MNVGPAAAGVGGGWAAAAPGAGNAAYRSQGLRYQGVEVNLDESVSLWTLFNLWLRAAIVATLVWLVFVLLSLVMLVLWLGAVASGEADSDTSTGGGLFLAGTFLSVIVFWVVLLLSQIQEPISEWKTLLEDKAPAASSAYAAIFGVLQVRRTPLGKYPMRVRSDILGQEIVNNRLVITDQSYVAYVSVFEYGTSLYVGWSMFRTRLGAVLIGVFFKDLFGALLRRAGLVEQMLRTERARAMREALHSAVREGVEVAIEGVEVPIASTFGQDLQIHDIRRAGPPQPPAPQVAGYGPSPGYGPAPGYAPAPAPPTGHWSAHGQTSTFPTVPASGSPAPGPPDVASPASEPPASDPPASGPPASGPPASGPPASPEPAPGAPGS